MIDLLNDFTNIGIKPGMTVLVHTSLSKIGMLENGPQEFIDKLEKAVTTEGSIVMPAQYRNKNYTPNTGIISETFRLNFNTIKTNQIIAGFSCWGKNCRKLASNIEYTDDGISFEYGEQSPLARIYEEDGWILMVGTDYSTCTSLHLAENRADWKGKIIFTEKLDFPGVGHFTFTDVKYEEEDFNLIGKAFEDKFWGDQDVIRFGKIGNAESRLIKMKLLVDYAEKWMNTNRGRLSFK